MSQTFDLSNMQMQGTPGMDDFIAREPAVVTPKTARVKIASIADLAGFTRIGLDTLVHKADKDLWTIRKQTDGSMFVERMFNDDGKPLHV
jgi:hypothetical protein